MTLEYDITSPQSDSSDSREAHVEASLIHESRALRHEKKHTGHCRPIAAPYGLMNTSNAKLNASTSH